MSDGRIGYIHIRSMSGGELRKFEREFIAEHIDKDAIIVDVRFNCPLLVGFRYPGEQKNDK